MKYKPSVNQTIRGRSTSALNNKKYNLTEQALQLKVTARLSTFSNDNILPLVLTIKYAESIPDLVVSINTGDKLFLTTFVNNIDTFEFKVEVENPNNSPAIIQIQELIPPPLTAQSSMNYIGVPGSDPALLAATLANATAINTLATAMNSQPNAIADAIANNQMIVENFPNTLVGSTLMQLLAVDQTRQSCIITNWHTVEVKLWTSTAALPNATTYSSDGAFITLDAAKVTGGVLKQGGVATLDVDESKGNVYAIANGAQGTKGVAITLTRTAP
jgi:hypothetical protein